MRACITKQLLLPLAIALSISILYMSCRKMDITTNTASSFTNDDDFLHWVNTQNANWPILISEKQERYNEIKNKDSAADYFLLDIDKVIQAEDYFTKKIAKNWGVDTSVARERLNKVLSANSNYYDSLSRSKFPLAEEWLLYHKLLNDGELLWIGFAHFSEADETVVYKLPGKKIADAATVPRSIFGDRTLPGVTVTDSYCHPARQVLEGAKRLYYRGIRERGYSCSIGIGLMSYSALRRSYTCHHILYMIKRDLQNYMNCLSRQTPKRGGGGGGGGGPLPPNPPIGDKEKDKKPQKDPCEEAQKAAQNIKDTHKQRAAQGKDSTLTAPSATEKGIALYEKVAVDPHDNTKVTTNYYYSGNMASGSETNVTVPISVSNWDALVSVSHYHPVNGYSAPSAHDVFEVISNSRINIDRYTQGRFVGNFVEAADGSSYALVVNNSIDANVFFNNKSSNLASNGGWNSDSGIGKDFEKAQKFYLKEYGDDTAEKRNKSYEEAMGFVLNKHNTGVTLMKKDASGNFKPIIRTTIKNGRKTTYINPCP